MDESQSYWVSNKDEEDSDDAELSESGSHMDHLQIKPLNKQM